MGKRMAYLVHEVSNFAAWKEYLETILGFDTAEVGDELLGRCDDYLYRIVLRNGPADDIAAFGLEVDTLTELAAVREALEKRGITVSTAPAGDVAKRRVHSMLTATLPGPLDFEIIYGPTLQHHKLRTNARVPRGFRTGELGLGHIVLGSPEMDDLGEVLTEALGFKISDYERADDDATSWATFYHCNPRHHSLAAMNTPRRGRMLDHFMVEMNDLDDMGLMYNRALEAGIVHTMLGRHINDQMLSFYMYTPSGFRVEAGVFGRLLTPDHRVELHDVYQAWGHHPTGVTR